MTHSSHSRTIALLIAVSFLLVGCVLQSQTAVFPETKGVEALASIGSRFTSESLGKDGTWVKEEDEITFTPSGNHYVAQNTKEMDTITILFAPLDAGRFVMQAQEAKDKPYAYMLAEIADGHVLMSPLLCDDLKTDAAVAAEVTFQGSDCFVKGAWNGDSFARAAKLLGPAKMRLTPVK